MNTTFISKLCYIVLYFGLALFFFGFAFPYLELLIGIAALVLGILQLQ
jgi:hypothetical protein